MDGNKVIKIEAGKTESQYWKDVFRFRELFYFLAWRDILVRYKQTAIGISWAVLRPFLTMVVFTIIFGKFARFPSDGVPYPLLVFAGMLPWQFFSSAVSESSVSLISNTNLVTKIYFPRLVIPTSSVVVSFVDLIISFVILAFLFVWYQYRVSALVLWLPLFLILAFGCAMGSGLWLSALNVKYRDFRYIVPFIVQFGQYISPVGFSSTIVPADMHFYYALNPMVGVIDCFRWALLGKTEFPMMSFLVSTGIILIILLSGVRYFRRTEKYFADII